MMGKEFSWNDGKLKRQDERSKKMMIAFNKISRMQSCNWASVLIDKLQWVWPMFIEVAKSCIAISAQCASHVEILSLCHFYIFYINLFINHTFIQTQCVCAMHTLFSCYIKFSSSCWCIIESNEKCSFTCDIIYKLLHLVHWFVYYLVYATPHRTVQLHRVLYCCVVFTIIWWILMSKSSIHIVFMSKGLAIVRYPIMDTFHVLL